MLNDQPGLGLLGFRPSFVFVGNAAEERVLFFGQTVNSFLGNFLQQRVNLKVFRL